MINTKQHFNYNLQQQTFRTNKKVTTFDQYEITKLVWS